MLNSYYQELTEDAVEALKEKRAAMVLAENALYRAQVEYLEALDPQVRHLHAQGMPKKALENWIDYQLGITSPAMQWNENLDAPGFWVPSTC